jgi:hypothetical protein
LRSPTGWVVIYKSQEALSTEQGLLKAGADDRLLGQYIVCTVPSETKVLDITGQISSAFLSGADGTRDVVVATGNHAGCQGVVAEDHLRK